MLFYESEVLLPMLEVWVLLLEVVIPPMLLVFVTITSFDFESAEALLVSLPLLSVAIGATTVNFDVMRLEGL
jgi:hypothetical protein